MSRLTKGVSVCLLGAALGFAPRLLAAPTQAQARPAMAGASTPSRTAHARFPTAHERGGGATETMSQFHPAVVRIAAAGDNSTSYGSGTLVGVNEQQGLVITNWHVINEATQSITIIFPDGFQSSATICKVDRDWDLAALATARPRVRPIPIAAEPAKPGDLLTIAGYGSGDFRAVNGRCTQYVAPGAQFPFEMVELAAAARRGDSGGPIVNSRGELVGVLFGEGGGHTTGSYCGRVRWFLDSLLRPAADVPGSDEKRLVAAASQRGVPGAQVASLARSLESARREGSMQSTAPVDGSLEAARFRGAPSRDASDADENEIRLSSSPDEVSRPAEADFAARPWTAASAASRATTANSQDAGKAHSVASLATSKEPASERPAIASTAAIGASSGAAANADLTSDSLADLSFDNIKTVLAAIGGVALLAQFARLIRSEPAPATKDKDKKDSD